MDVIHSLNNSSSGSYRCQNANTTVIIMTIIKMSTMMMTMMIRMMTMMLTTTTITTIIMTIVVYYWCFTPYQLADYNKEIFLCRKHICGTHWKQTPPTHITYRQSEGGYEKQSRHESQGLAQGQGAIDRCIHQEDTGHHEQRAPREV